MPGRNGGGAPAVSVILPLRNERDSVEACLSAVLGQDYPADRIEVIVVDGGSSDGSTGVVEALARKDARIRLLHSPAGTIPAGLNVGIRAARGHVIARVDARALLAPDYIRTAVALLEGTGAANVGGPVRSVTRTTVGYALALAWSSRFGLGGAAARYGETTEQWTDTVYLGVFPRQVLEASGLYDEAILQDEDTELNYRIRAGGGRILMSPRLRSTYLNQPTLGRIARKNFQFGWSKALVWRKHPRMIQIRHLIPPAFVGALLLGLPLGALHPMLLLLWASVAATYALVCLAVTAAHLVRSRRGAALLLPLIFPLLHFSWGSGFLWGALRVLPRGGAR
jgi:glycosyltransferase involved in cell wall biosynthesis